MDATLAALRADGAEHDADGSAAPEPEGRGAAMPKRATTQTTRAAS